MVNDSSGRAAGCVCATLSFSNYITGNTGPCATAHRNFFNFEFRIIIEHYALGRGNGRTCVLLRRYIAMTCLVIAFILSNFTKQIVNCMIV